MYRVRHSNHLEYVCIIWKNKIILLTTRCKRKNVYIYGRYLKWWPLRIQSIQFLLNKLPKRLKLIRTICSNSRPSTTVSTTEKVKQEATAMPLPVSTSTQQPSQTQGTPDPYLTHFDPRSEHQSYKQAQMRLEEVHKEKVTKVSSINRSEKRR